MLLEAHKRELVILSPMMETLKLLAKSDEPEALIQAEGLLRNIVSLTVQTARIKQGSKVVEKPYPDSAVWAFKQGTRSIVNVEN